MLRISLTPDQQAELTQLVRQAPAHRVRQRSQALLWSHQGMKRQQIAELFQVKADTVTAWFRRWQAQPATPHLADAPRSGRRPTLSEDQKKRCSSK